MVISPHTEGAFWFYQTQLSNLKGEKK